jgi:glutamate carboxypeptidase
MSANASNIDVAALRAQFVGRLSEILALTRALVETESPSGDETGSKAVVSLLASAARGIPGIDSVERVTSEHCGEHLRLRAFNSRERPIVIIGHTDTVHPRGSLQQRPWRVEGNRAFGPGVFDMKANCALAMEALRACAALRAASQRPVIVLLTCDEERGRVTGRSLVEAEAKRAHAVLVIEPPAPNGRVKTGRKGTGIFTIVAHGRAAHAGLEPEKGASAVLEIARQIQVLHDLNDPVRGISVNVGTVQGGTASNVVAAEARAEVDIRFSTSVEATFLQEQIRSLRPVDERIRLVISGGINRPPLERSDKVVALYEQAKGLAAAIGFDLGEAQVGGASDGNFAAAVGASVLDGLGVAGAGAHAADEHILIDDLPARGALLTGLLATLS